VLALAVVASLFLGAVAGLLLFGPEPEPSDQSAEAGFARDMSVHHAQAVQLAFAVREASDDPAIDQLAYDIITTQQAQVGMFSGWLQQWGLPTTSTRRPMAWAGHDHGGDQAVTSYSDMPGMASESDLERLRELDGVAAQRLFYELMIEHHRGGIEMARAVVPLTERPEVQRLARTIVEGQQAEIDNMQESLDALR
jgi:uncharacterized protein (DUF305 family)